MALIKCPECDGYISDSAEACPHCGCPKSKYNIPYFSVQNAFDFDIGRTGCLEKCKNQAKTVILPDNITSIGEWAFAGCKCMESIYLREGVTSIGGWAFNGCKSLNSITIPNSVTSIDSFAFSGCTSLTIYAPAGSYAERYAYSNNIRFVAI